MLHHIVNVRKHATYSSHHYRQYVFLSECNYIVDVHGCGMMYEVGELWLLMNGVPRDDRFCSL